MTAVDDRSQTRDHALTPEAFEHLASLAARETEGLRLELVGGKLGVKAVSDVIHTSMTMWLVRQCIQQQPEWDLHVGQGLKIETHRNGRAIPDGVLAPVNHLVETSRGEWAEPGGVLMTVEITSFDRDTTQRDRIDKPRAYAESAIPVYLLIDRDTREVTVHSEPDGGVYQKRVIVPFGKTVALPDPVGIELDTQRLLTLMSAEDV
ncbi:Uma2 family endonuclease [Streptomyces cocklensis]|uniref:Restriction endonuclease n=1 Tax=Actinacidiphila cocklensis TaxID=887465 RepID=A0A9W4DWI3_9ACTN|nr:Uma2 family endonuclease [Actinacidiphila cocklensis]MDD1063000.1 Uma2 family endonuclease [Actinacidiphila cocklensis]WSX78596.1 Uma2 family endonuclease [Streptomyces sp. NBC_00899]CAG6394797.1 Putative restriction endonuclease [Actinacidiphila cocklensis]